MEESTVALDLAGEARLTEVPRLENLKIKQALKNSEGRFRRVVESAPSAMVMIGPAGTIETVNAQAELVFGCPRAELLGQFVEMLVPMRFRKHHPGPHGSFSSDLDRGRWAPTAVSDNGVGISGDLDFAGMTTLGLQLVTRLTSQLGAEMTVNRSNPTNLTLQLSVES